MAGGNESSLGAGDRVGRFRLLAPLGEGSMGRIWLAEGPAGPVALKLLYADVVGGRERFELEARALLKLRHLNVVRAIDYGHAADETPFMALELLDGESLDHCLARRGRLPVTEAMTIVSAAAKGLSAAHELGIIHRDVKPGNIFLCSDYTVKVLDFGIAFFSAADGRLPVARLTEPGTVMGTPSYMAPEQAMGDMNEDERTDVWGLGAVLYDMIAGRVPFEAGENYLAELTRILTEPADPLPDDIPEPLAQVILRAMSKDPDDRYATMSQFAAALRMGDHPPPSARKPKIDPGVMGALAEVRLVSAVFAVGLDPDAEQSFMAAVTRHVGVGSPIRGGRAVAVFGGEAWLGDEAERAVKLSLEVRSQAERIGIGTGKAVRRLDQGGLVTGQAVAAAQKVLSATATRIPTLVPPAPGSSAGIDRSSLPPGAGAVMACPETQRRIQGRFELAGARVVGERHGGRAVGPREVGGHEVPLIGRSAQLDELIRLVDDAGADERATAALILGPPGIGKSRLRYELVRWLEEEEVEARQLWAHGELAHGRSSFGVLRALLRRQADLPDGTERSQAHAKIVAMVESAAPTDGTQQTIAESIGELLGAPFPETPQLRAARSDPQLMADRIRLACGSLFEGWTQQGLVLVSVENAQWADAASLALLDSLLSQLADRPLAIVATARPAMLTEHDAFGTAQRIELGELPPEDIGAIVECVLGRREGAVVKRAAGNPYLAEELSLAVREGADPEALPLTVEGIVLARLDHLAPDEKDLLKRAAVVGPFFWREALEALGEPLADRLLRRLRRRELVVPRADSRLAGCEEWVFRHTIVHEVCRSLLTDEQRRALHRAAASWLSHHGDAAPEHVAEHFETACEPKRASLWWIRAVHAAHARGDSRNVTRFAERVLALAKESELPAAELFSCRLLRCEAWYWLAEREALEQELTLAGQLAASPTSRLGDAAIAQLRHWQAQHVQRAGHFEPATFAAKEAVRLADASAAYELRVQARATLSELLAAQGELDQAAAIAAEALDIAKRGEGSMVRATAARALATVQAQRGQLSESLFYYRMGRDLCMEVGGLREATLDSIGLGACLTMLGEYEQADRLLAKTLTTAQSLDLGSIIGWVKHHRSLVLQQLGEHETAGKLQEDALQAARSLGDVHLTIAALQAGSILRRASGHSAKALASAEQALATAERLGNRTAEPLCRTLRAQALVDSKRFPEALEECERASAARDAVGGMLDSEVELLLARHDALVGLGRAEQALAALQDARRSFEARRETIENEALRRTFETAIPAHARLASLLAQKR